MEFEDTQMRPQPDQAEDATESSPTTAPREPLASGLRTAAPHEQHEQLDQLDQLDEKFERIGEGDKGMGFETRRQQGLVAAALFDEDPLPVRIGRFLVIRELGAGGMGVVYVAYDEQLDRRVAVKLLRGADPDSDARSRLAREAQAMARLRHPHVVTVHEVGEFEGQVFVAMEFVEGSDLRGWMDGHKDCSWREVVALFLQAGRGLEAAHEVGLVHRDFKPDNVLVGKDGRALVADFGLAHAFDAQPQMREVDVSLDAEDSSSNHLDTPLTKTGAIMGTPAYMAPEQYAGIRSDARGDQFSFCVALWEALHGARPFSGANLFSLSHAITNGQIDAPPEHSEVPTWLRAILARGLSSDPDLRWPSMGELIDALSDDPQARRRRRVLWGSGVSLTLSLVAGLSWLAVTQVQQNTRSSYWSELTEQLLSLERERGLRQANDDATRARDATRMSVLRSYQPEMALAEHEDPTTAAVLLREVEGDARASEAWLSTANELLSQEISYQVLQGHRDTVSALLFSPAGESVYSGSFDGEVRRWNVDSGAGELISAHENHVTELASSPDGKLIASSAHDQTVRLWSAETGRSEVLARHGRPVMSIDIDASGRWLASASKDGTVQLHDLAARTHQVLDGGGGPVYVVRFDASGKWFVTGSADGKLRIWDTKRPGSPRAVLEGHSKDVFHMRVLDDGRIVSASDDGSARLWARDHSSRVLTQHASAVTALDARGGRAVSASDDGSILVANLDARTPARTLTPHTQAVWSVALTPDGERVVSGSFDQTARLARTDGRGAPRTFSGHRLALLRLAIDPSGRWLSTGSYDSDVRLWDLEREPNSIELGGHKKTVYMAERDHRGERVVTASHDGSARVWDARDGTCLHVLAGGQDNLNHALFSPTGELVATARTSGEIELWELQSGTRRVLLGHEKSAWHLSFDTSGALLASSSHDETVRLWDVADGRLRHTLRGHRNLVTAVSVQPNGERVASAGHDGELRIWNTETGELITILTGHTGRISALARSPDGRTLATGSDDGTARIWLSDDPADAVVLSGHEKMIWTLTFDAEGKRLATLSHDTRVRVWDTHDGELLQVFEGHSDALWDVEFLPDGRLLTASSDQTLRLWHPEGSSLALTGHHAAVVGVELLMQGHRALSYAEDGKLRLWQLDELHTREQALTELESVTRHCLTVEQRVRELGEDLGEAERARGACRARGAEP